MSLSLISIVGIMSLAMISLPALAKSGGNAWFLHEFGEMRAYHGDFLNVCAGEGLNQCRTVQYGFGDDEESKAAHFFGNTRLAVERLPGAGDPFYSIEIFIREMPMTPQGPFVLSIDGTVFPLTQTDWKAGSQDGANVAETITIARPELVAELVAQMKTGNSLRVLYEGSKEVRFQLRGFRKALEAIETRVNSAK